MKKYTNEEIKVSVFDSYIKRVIKNTCLRYYNRQYSHNKAEEIYRTIQNLNMQGELGKDTVLSECNYYDFNDYIIIFQNDLFFKAFSLLNEQEKNILLLYYLDNMTDELIGRRLNLNRKKVNRSRKKILENIKGNCFYE